MYAHARRHREEKKRQRGDGIAAFTPKSGCRNRAPLMRLGSCNGLPRQALSHVIGRICHATTSRPCARKRSCTLMSPPPPPSPPPRHACACTCAFAVPPPGPHCACPREHLPRGARLIGQRIHDRPCQRSAPPVRRPVGSGEMERSMRLAASFGFEARGREGGVSSLGEPGRYRPPMSDYRHAVNRTSRFMHHVCACVDPAPSSARRPPAPSTPPSRIALRACSGPGRPYARLRYPARERRSRRSLLCAHPTAWRARQRGTYPRGRADVRWLLRLPEPVHGVP